MPRVGIASFYTVWTNPENDICGAFAARLFGGGMASMPCGITNSIMTNVGAAILMKLVNLIRFKNNHWRLHVSVLSIAWMTYFNAGILPMIRFTGYHWMPPDFTPEWVLFYSKMIMTSMILSNVMPYLGSSIKIAKSRCCCCCKRKNYKPNTHLNPVFPIERRYASLIATSFICFSYGLTMPVLFIVFTGLLMF